MGKLRLPCLLMLIFSWLSLPTVANTAAKAPSPQIKLEDFVRLPSARNVKISPDGKHLSVVFKKDGVDMLGILDFKTKTATNVFRVFGTGNSVGQTYWVNNERIVYTVRRSYSWHKSPSNTSNLIGVNIDGSKHKMIYGLASGTQQIGTNIKKKQADYGFPRIIDLLKDDDENILILVFPFKLMSGWYEVNESANPIVYKMNVFNGRKRRIDALPIAGAHGITDNDGNMRFAVGSNKENERKVAYKDIGSEKWEDFELSGFEGRNIWPLSFTKDNKNVYLEANVGNGTRALYLLNLENKSVEKIFHDPQVDVSLNIRDFDGRRVVAVGTDLALPKYHYLDKKDKKAKLHKQLINAFKGYDIFITSSTENNDRFIVKVHSDSNPGDYYLFETKGLNAEFLMTERPWINPQITAFTESVEIPTRDGKTIYGYLTKPNHLDKNMPLVVLPHGGPHGIRDYWGFDWEVQLLANRGYGVLQVNYRGSGGFGLAFEEAGHAKWGTLMQDDLTDATNLLVKNGIADPNRICIYGASYGGYAALMGAVREPELYKCTIGSVGVYDLPMMFNKGDIPDSVRGIAYLKDVLGNDVEDQKRRSPAYNAEKIKAEVFLIHGANDRRVPIEQAEALKDAFDKIDKTYDWLEIPNEGHGYYDEGNRLLVYGEILKFLDKNIGSQAIN